MNKYLTTLYRFLINLYLILFLSFPFVESIAQENRFHHSYFSTLDGLPHNTVWQMMQDRRGIIWAATSDGVCRFTGRRFEPLPDMEQKDTIYTPYHNEIVQLHEDSNGFVWMRTREGQYCCYDPRHETFVRYADPRILDNSYQGILTDSLGVVWLWGNRDGCVRISYDDGNFTAKGYMLDDIEFYDNEVYLIAESRDLGKVIVARNSIYLYQKTMKCIYRDEEQLQILGYVESHDKIYFFTQSSFVLIYDKRLHKFLKPVPLPKELSGQPIIGLMGMEDQQILFSTADKVYSFNTKTLSTDRAESFFGETVMRNVKFKQDNGLNVWCYDQEGNVWIYLKNNEELVKLKLDFLKSVYLKNHPQYSFYQDSRGLLWITTYGDGLYMYDPQAKKTIHFQSKWGGLKTVISNDLLSIMEDSSGVLWMGTEYNGISRIAIPHYTVNTIYPMSDNFLKRANSINTILEDSLGMIWMGGALGNLYIYDSSYQLQQCIETSLEWNCAEKDVAGDIWMGSKDKGIYVYSLNGQLKRSFRADPKKFYGLPSDKINDLLCDKAGRMWVAQKDKGLSVALKERHSSVEEEEYRFRSFFVYEKGANTIYTMMIDNEGYIWASGNEGLYVFNPDSLLKDDSRYYFISYSKYDTRKILSKHAQIIYEDRHKRIWIASKDGGLTCYIPQSDFTPSYVKYYTIEDGLPNNTVTGITEDTFGVLWLTTENGVCRFNAESCLFENFIFSDITLGNVFNPSSLWMRSNGDLLLGSMCGCYQLDPVRFNKNSYLPPVIISAMKVNGENFVVGGEHSPLSEAISYTSEVKLRYDKSVLEFEFLLPNYNDDKLNKYTYKLNGFDKHWNKLSEYNQALYRNLPPGNYELVVKGGNGAGVWGTHQTTLQLTITPPFYSSIYAWILYVILLVVVFYLIYRVTIRFNDLRNRVRIEQELNNYKIRFLSNMTNELKRPLNIALDSLGKLEKESYLTSQTKRVLSGITRNIRQITYMTEMLFETETKENGQIELALEQANVVTFLYDVYHEFIPLAQSKEIKFEFESSEDQILLPIDKIKFGKIISNILIYSFDLTSSKGGISMQLFFDSNQFSVSIECGGKELSSHFYTLIEKKEVSADSLTTTEEVALRQAYELLQIHQGKLEYRKTEHERHCFVIYLSVDRKMYNEKDFMHKLLPREDSNTLESLFMMSDNDFDTIEHGAYLKYQLLFVSVEKLLADYLECHLSPFFRIIRADSIQEGQRLMQQNEVSLLLSSLTLEQTEVFRFVKSCKEDYQTCHIPIVLLSVDMSIDYQVKGIEAGADAFIVKPFSLKYLVARIVKLCEQRDKLLQRFSEETSVLPNIAVEEKDKMFIEQINKEIEGNIMNADFSVDDLMESVQMKRTVFYKRLKSLTGYSPNEYIRTLRMKKAVELLRTQQYNISEVCYKIGFTDPFYFSRCFKAHFGESPSVWMKKQEQNKEKTE